MKRGDRDGGTAVSADIEPVPFECDSCGDGFLDLFETADGWVCNDCLPMVTGAPFRDRSVVTVELPEMETDATGRTVVHLGMTFEEAADNVGRRVQYVSPSGALVSYGVIDRVGIIAGVGALSVFVRFGLGVALGEPEATDPRRLRLLPEREAVQA